MGDEGEVAQSHCARRLHPHYGFVGLVALPPSTHAFRLAGALEGAGLCDRRHRLFAERRLVGGVAVRISNKVNQRCSCGKFPKPKANPKVFPVSQQVQPMVIVVPQLDFSPDGRLLAVGYLEQGVGKVDLFKVSLPSLKVAGYKRSRWANGC